MSEKRNRESWLDVCKGIGILLVLLGHTDIPIYWLIFGFHMPMFFMISGYLYSDDQGSWNDFLKKIFRKYVIPYFLFQGINLIIYIGQALYFDLLSEDLIISIWNLIMAIVYCRTDYMPNSGPLWYLVGFSITLIIFRLLREVDSRNFRVLFLIISIWVAYMVDFLEWPKSIWNIHSALMAVLFVEIGYILRKISFFERYSGLKTIDKLGIFLVMVIGGYASIYYNSMIPMDVDINGGRYGILPMMLSGAILLSLAFLTLCYIWGRRINKLTMYAYVLLQKLGRHTIFILAFDMATQSWAEIILNHTIGYTVWYFQFMIKIVFLFIGYIVWKNLVEIIMSDKIKRYIPV